MISLGKATKFKEYRKNNKTKAYIKILIDGVQNCQGEIKGKNWVF
jgi:hypothetical protein